MFGGIDGPGTRMQCNLREPEDSRAGAVQNMNQGFPAGFATLAGLVGCREGSVGNGDANYVQYEP
jgi:hypothetical protein